VAFPTLTNGQKQTSNEPTNELQFFRLRKTKCETAPTPWAKCRTMQVNAPMGGLAFFFFSLGGVQW